MRRRTPSPASLLLSLAGCGNMERLSRVGRAPEMSPVANPTADPAWRPVSMPMPAPQEAPAVANSLWRPGSRTFLRDQRAAQVGDVITILVSIQDEAQLQNRTQRARQGNDKLGIPQLFGMQTRWLPRGASPDGLFEAAGGQTSDGTGTVKRIETVTLCLAATVTQVLPNGNLMVGGRQEVRVNAELRELAVQGVIRPQDIASDNTIRHDRLAEARIAYGGRGTLSDLQQPRYGQQILDAVLLFRGARAGLPAPVAPSGRGSYTAARTGDSRRAMATLEPDTHPAPRPNPALAAQAAILARPATGERRMADALRALAIDAVEAAKSGHPGMPMGMADAATALWTRFLRFDAADPRWPDRDRFVLSAGHGSMLLYGLLHLTGHAGMGTEELKRFRQLHSPAAGHPELGEPPGIETTTGPLGQGFANAVGMAVAERLLNARFGDGLVDHRTWVVASDGDLMEGISHEAASLAGHLRLSKLTVLYDDNNISIDGETSLSLSDDALRRFESYGWAAKRVDGHDAAAVSAALEEATRSDRPTLIACRTIIGFAAPKKAGTAASHGAPLGPEEAAAAKSALGWNHPPFEVPDGLRETWSEAGRRGASEREAWLRRLAEHPERAAFERAMAGRLPDGWNEPLIAFRAKLAEERPKLATRVASQRALVVLVPQVPEMVGGSADLTGSNNTNVEGVPAVSPGNWAGRYIHYGVREHGMAAAMNGMAVHGGIIPYSGTFLVFGDYMRPSIRLAALMRQRVVHVLTHDSIGLGEDGPTHQPVEHLASFRAMPNLRVFRPGDAVETAECWELAVARADGPSVLALSRQNLPAFRTEAGAENRCARGGYVVAESPSGPRRATLIATGSEVQVALAASDLLAAEGIPCAVVSLPCWELFAEQDEAYRTEVLGADALRVGIEAASPFGWSEWLGERGLFVGMAGFGASAPAEALFRHFGITPEAVTAAVRKRFAH